MSTQLSSDSHVGHEASLLMRSVVVGQDGSPESSSALRWAMRNASDDIHVVRAVSPATELLEASIQIDSNATFAHANAELDAAISLAGGPDERVCRHTVEDSVPNALIDVARRFGVDAIVVGSHGHERFGHMVGANTGRLLHLSDVPVVVVPDDDDRDVDEQREVVVGLSGDRGADQALLHWVVARLGPSPVRLVRAVPPSLVATVPVPFAFEAFEEHTYAYMAGLSGTADQLETVVFDEPLPALAQASSLASVIVIGSHRSSRISGFLTGSIAQHLPTVASCPVVVVPLVESSPGSEP